MRAPVHELVHRTLVSVEREHDGLVVREQRLELRVAHAMRMLARRKKREQIDHVDDAHSERWRETPQEPRGSDGLERRRIAGAREHDVRLAAA